MKKTRFACAVAFFLASSLNGPEPVQAELADARPPVEELANSGGKSLQSQKQPEAGSAPDGRTVGTASRYYQHPNAPDAPKGGRRKGAGDRGECPIVTAGTEVTPLIPENGWGWTARDSPTIWVHIAYPTGSLQNSLSGEVSLEEYPSRERSEQISVDLPKRSGAFSMQLPYRLEANQWYQWYLSIDCNSPDSANGDTVVTIEGLLKRVERPELGSQPDKPSTGEVIVRYAERGLWYDALDEAAKLACSDPQAVQRGYWEALLRDDEVKLPEEIVSTQVFCPEQS